MAQFNQFEDFMSYVSVLFILPKTSQKKAEKRHKNVTDMYRNLPTKVVRALRRRFALIYEACLLSAT